MFGSRGFTLVELMVVVAVIGILSAIAIPNFLNYRMKAKTAEATSSLSAIRTLEASYFTEMDRYLTGQDWTPSHGADHSTRIAWDSTTRYSQLGFAPDSTVYYEYRLEPVGSLTSDTFTARARSDHDNDNAWSEYFISDAGQAVQHSGDLY